MKPRLRVRLWRRFYGMIPQLYVGDRYLIEEPAGFTELT
jgi:hypothetical protein